MKSGISKTLYAVYWLKGGKWQLVRGFPATDPWRALDEASGWAADGYETKIVEYAVVPLLERLVCDRCRAEVKKCS